MDRDGKSRILVVHPEASERERLSEILSRNGHPSFLIHEAESTGEALTLYHAFGPDCVVMEHGHPDLDSARFLLHLKQQTGESSLPVILICDPAHEATALRALKMGAQDYLIESRVDEDLRFAVDSVIQKGRLFRQIREHRRELELGARALEESEERHRVLVEGVTDYAIVMLDPGGRIISWNIGAENLFGERAEQVVGEPYSRYFTDESIDRGDPDRMLALACEAGRMVEEGWLIRRDGERFLANISISALRDHDGLLRGFASVTRDVTERVRTQSEILELNARLERRLRRINALRRIDLAIASERDLGAILKVVVEQARGELGVEAALILLSDRSGGTLSVGALAGFPESFCSSLEYGSGGLSRRVVRSGCALHVPDLARVLTPDPRLPRLLELGFRAYHAVPLAVDQRILGVMECFRRDANSPDSEWLDFLRILARQASIAVEHVELFAGLRASNVQLGLAYDATIESLSRAMDLRDHETEGHSRRVTELTVRLGRKMGLSEIELVQVRRGALLHDIGKLGVPDRILLKPGALTEEEWTIMKRHPTYAIEILGTIDFLKPALDIPHYHHERFDGRGYPAGLAGEEIPLPARMFAAVDIWDALSNDRPYRKAWPKEQVVEHIGSLSGAHLDPQVVTHFLEMVRVESDAQDVIWPMPVTTSLDQPTLGGGLARAAAMPGILVVHPDGDRSREVARKLHELGLSPTIATDHDDAWRRIQDNVYEVIIIDCSCQRVRSLDLVTRLRAMTGRSHAHVIAIRDPEIQGDLSLSPRLIDDLISWPGAQDELGPRLELARGSLELRRELLTRSVETERLQDELRRRGERIADLAATDHLTGLANRRQILEALGAFLAMSSRRDEPISILMLDLDYFRAFNEELGHAAGDEALRTIAEVLRQAIRRNDLAARYGGDEFVVLLTPCDQETASLVAERIRKFVARADWTSRPVTTSIGIATCQAAPWDGDELLAKADHALAMAKRRGRDRVINHDDLVRRQHRELSPANAEGTMG